MSILVIGDVTLDIFLEISGQDADLHCNLKQNRCEICFNYDQKIPVKTLQQAVGGNAANVAIGLSLQQVETSILTHVGNDEAGRKIVEQLKGTRVDISQVQTEPKGQTNHAFIIDYRSEKTVFSYHAQRSYQFKLRRHYDYVFITSMAQTKSETYIDELNQAVKKGTRLIYEPGTLQIRAGVRSSQALLQQCHILILNKAEAKQLIRDNEDSERALLHKLLDLGPQEVVITDGTRGAFVSNGQQFYHGSIWRTAKKIESTGAGDSFTAGYIAARLQGLDLQLALKRGAINAGSVVQQVGAQAGLLTQAEISQLEPKVDIKIRRLYEY